MHRLHLHVPAGVDAAVVDSALAAAIALLVELKMPLVEIFHAREAVRARGPSVFQFLPGMPAHYIDAAKALDSAEAVALPLCYGVTEIPPDAALQLLA